MYATTTFFNNRQLDDPYSFVQAEKERREKAKLAPKKDSTPVIEKKVEDDRKKQSKMVKKYM